MHGTDRPLVSIAATTAPTVHVSVSTPCPGAMPGTYAVQNTFGHPKPQVEIEKCL